MRILLTILLIFGTLHADHDEYEYERERHIPRDLGFLHLDREQEARLREVLSENSRRLEELYMQTERAEREFKRLFLQDRFDKDRFEKEFMRLKREMVRVEVEMLSQIHAVLTPRQREKFVEYMEEWELE